MIRYSSSVHKSDWECSSKSVRGSLFVNPLYIKNLTNLTNLTTLQTLQPYRFLCRVPKGPHAYLCTLHKGGLPAPCELHEICSFSSLLRAFQSNWEIQFWKQNFRLPARFEANQKWWLGTVWTVKNKKDPPKQVLLVAASPQRCILSPFTGGWWRPGDASSRQRWTQRHRHNIEWSWSAGLPGLRRF